jgi:hypothetical protein
MIKSIILLTLMVPVQNNYFRTDTERRLEQQQDNLRWEQQWKQQEIDRRMQAIERHQQWGQSFV